MGSYLTAALGRASHGGRAVAGWTAAAVLAAACAAAWFVFARKPFIHDLPLMHFIAWRIGEGDIPYRDLWDMNGPATYLIHMALLGLPFSYSSVAAAGMTVLTAIAAFCACTVAGRNGKPVAGAMFGLALLLWLTGRGEEMAMQRDLMIAVCGAGALALATQASRTAWRWALAGALAGFAVGIKPTAAAFAAILMAGAVWLDLVDGSRLRRTIALAAGGALGGTIWLGLLAATGSLQAWWSIMSGYNVAYANIARAPLGGLVLEGGVIFAACAALACLGLAAVVAKKRLADSGTIVDLVMASGFAAVGAALYVIQGKGWGYHLAPAGVFGVLGFGMAANASRLVRPSVTMLASIAVALALASQSLGGIRMQYSRPFAESYANRVAFVAEMSEALRSLPPGMKVQPLDTTYGALHAMLEAQRAPASPLLYDFWLFTGSQDDQKRAREVVMQALKRGDSAVLLTNQGWPLPEGDGFERMQEFKEFESILAQRYALTAEGGSNGHVYRLFTPIE